MLALNQALDQLASFDPRLAQVVEMRFFGGLELSEIAPLLIIIKLEGHNYAGATAIATIMLVISFAMLFVINLLQAWSRKWFGHE